jgi:excinuclease UvrABC ATPase subunit
MICQRCEGDGMILVDDPARRDWAEPCPDCDGMGIAYCCEGASMERRDE